MADFYGALSSTSFRVKDREAWLADPDVQRLQAQAEGDGFFEESRGHWAFGWYGQYPSWVLSEYNPDTDESDDLDLTNVIERHILPGDVCQIGVSGNEKLRYIGGGLCWVTSRGTAYIDATTQWDQKLTEKSLRSIVSAFGKSVSKALRTKKKGK